MVPLSRQKKKILTLVATYKTHISIQLMLDHVILGSFLGHVGGGKWPQDEAKTMPCAVYFYYDNSAVYSKSLLKLFKRFRTTQCYQVYHYKLPGSYQ